MRICYLVLLHHKFDQALRMVRRLARPGAIFVFHIDSSANAEGAATFRAKMGLTSAPAFYAQGVSSSWGAYAQAVAILRCVQVAFREGDGCDRYVLLSGQDYPIASWAQIADFFLRHPDKEFVEAFPRDLTDAAAPGWSPYFRFRRYHLWIGNRHLTVPFLRKGLPPIPIYHGSTWWALTHAAIQYIAEQFDSNKSLRRYLRTGFLVDEVYIPTLLMAAPFSSKVTGENVTYAQWTPTSGPHPKILRIDDLPTLLDSPKLFARKFDSAVDESLMDELDALQDK